jgi:hypothetical protein
MKNEGSEIAGLLAAWRRTRWWVLAGVAVAAVLAIGLVLSAQLMDQTGTLLKTPNNPDADIAPKDRVDLIRNAYQYQADNLTKLWTAIIGIFTVAAAGAAGVIAWRNYLATQLKNDIDREGLITDRFTKAIDQLGAEKDGKPNLEVRLGGIYALERIARDSPRDHWTIMEILTAYVRQNSRWIEPAFTSRQGSASMPNNAGRQMPGQALQPHDSGEPPLPRADVQAILTVIGRRELQDWRGHAELPRLDLHATDLRRAFLANCNLVGAVLWDVHFENADLREAHLEASVLWHAHFAGADLDGAHFDDAHIQGADLLEARHLVKQQVGSAAKHEGEEPPLLPPSCVADVD